MPKTETDADPGAVDRAERYARLAQLLDEWQQEDDDGYDWDVIEQEILNSGARCEDPPETDAK